VTSPAARCRGSFCSAAFLTSLLAISDARAQRPSTLTAESAARVDSVFAEFGPQTPGCALGVYRDGAIAYARGYGMASLEFGVPNSPTTVFDIGSTSKQFSAFSILLLEADGKLSIDDEVRKYIPELPAYGRPVTIRHLLNHTSGMRDYLTLMALRGTNFDGVTTDADALALIVRQHETNFAPGEEYLYSNSGFFLLSEIVKRVSGESLRTFAQRRIFEPLGMTRTHFHDDHTMIVPGKATGYSRRGGSEGGFRVDMSGFEQTGDGGVNTTVEDLLRWDENFYTTRVGSAALLDQLQTRSRLASGDTIDYALGVVIGERDGRRTVRHGGAWAGYRAELLRFPERHTSFAVLCNLGDASPSALADRVADIILGESATAAQRTLATSVGTASAAEATGAALARYTGSYWSERDGVRRVTLERDTLRLIGPSGPRALLPQGDGRFALGANGPTLVFHRPTAGAPTRIEVWQPRARKPSQAFSAFTPVTLPRAKLAEYAGRYYSAELDIEYTITADSGRLVLRSAGQVQALTPTVRDAFVTDEGLVVLAVRERGRVTGMRVGAGRVTNLRFVRR
jgi:CubicO group peptidase (beta-lactamase class C family)